MEASVVIMVRVKECQARSRSGDPDRIRTGDLHLDSVAVFTPTGISRERLRHLQSASCEDHPWPINVIISLLVTCSFSNNLCLEPSPWLQWHGQTECQAFRSRTPQEDEQGQGYPGGHFSRVARSASRASDKPQAPPLVSQSVLAGPLGSR